MTMQQSVLKTIGEIKERLAQTSSFSQYLPELPDVEAEWFSQLVSRLKDDVGRLNTALHDTIHKRLN